MSTPGITPAPSKLLRVNDVIEQDDRLSSRTTAFTRLSCPCGGASGQQMAMIECESLTGDPACVSVLMCDEDDNHVVYVVTWSHEGQMYLAVELGDSATTFKPTSRKRFV